MKEFLVYIAILLLPHHGFGQHSFLTINGNLRDAETNAPIAYANIHIKNKSVGTVSNASGDFSLFLPKEFVNDTLSISHVGYRTCYRIAGALVQSETIQIESRSTWLSEVTISGDDARRLITEVIAAMPDNYPTEPFLFEGFQRTWEKIDFIDSLTYPGTLIEAAFAVYDPGYPILQKNNKKTDNEDIYLIEIRRSSLMPGWNYNGNMLRQMLQQNMVRNNGSRILFIDSFLKFPNELEYEWAGTTEIDGERVEMINVNYPNDRNFPAAYKIFISEREKAILRFDLSGSSCEIDFKRPWHTDSLDVSYSFRRQNGKLYLSYARMKYVISNINVKAHKVTRTEHYSKEILINNVIDKNIEESRKKLGSPTTSKSLALQAKIHNPGFWKYYNILKENPTDREIIELFEKNGILEKQFDSQTDKRKVD